MTREELNFITTPMQILDAWYIPQGLLIHLPQNKCVVNPADKVMLLSELGLYDEALLALRRVIHYNIDRGYYFWNQDSDNQSNNQPSQE